MVDYYSDDYDAYAEHSKFLDQQDKEHRKNDQREKLLEENRKKDRVWKINGFIVSEEVLPEGESCLRQAESTCRKYFTTNDSFDACVDKEIDALGCAFVDREKSWKDRQVGYYTSNATTKEGQPEKENFIDRDVLAVIQERNARRAAQLELELKIERIEEEQDAFDGTLKTVTSEDLDDKLFPNWRYDLQQAKIKEKSKQAEKRLAAKAVKVAKKEDDKAKAYYSKYTNTQKKKRKAITLEEHRRDIQTDIDVSAVFEPIDQLAHACNEEQFHTLYPGQAISSLGLSLLPLGYGPECVPSKEVGQRDGMLCRHDAYMQCAEQFLSAQIDAAHSALKQAEEAHEERVAAESNVRLLTRGDKGIAVSIPFKEAPIRYLPNTVTVSECMEQLLYDGPSPPTYEDNDADITTIKGRSDSDTDVAPETAERAVASFCTDTTAYPVGNTVEEVGTQFNLVPPSTDSASVVQHGRRGFIRNEIFDALGPSKGDLLNCSCTQCIVVQNKTYENENTNEAAQTGDNAAEEDNTAAADDLISTQEAVDVGVAIPFVVGRITLKGTIVTVDEVTSTICGNTHPKFNAVVKLAANRIDGIVRVMRLGIDVSAEVELRLEHTAEGHSVVHLYNIPKTWVIGTNELDVVFDTYTNVSETNELHTNYLATNVRSSKVHTGFQRLFTVDLTTNALTERDLLSGTVVMEHPTVVIAPGDVWDVTPLMDIVVKPAGTGDVKLYNLVTGQTKTFPNAANPATTSFTYGLNGTINLLATMRYQYETFRGNPRVEFDTWIPWKKYERYASGYIIHLTHGSDVGNTIVVPAHIADWELADTQEYFADVRDDYRRLAYNIPVPQHNSHIFVLHSPGTGEFLLEEFADNYRLVDAPLVNATTLILRNFDNNLKTGYAAHSSVVQYTPFGMRLEDSSKSQFFLSPKYQNITMFDGAAWRQTKYNTSLFVVSFSPASRSRRSASQFKTLSAPHPIVRVNIGADNAGENNVGNLDTFNYISTALEIIELNVSDGTSRVLGHINEAQPITHQWFSPKNGGTVVYMTSDNVVHSASPLRSAAAFDVALGVRKMLGYLQIPSIVDDNVPSFLAGFALIGDSAAALLKNLYYTTGVSVRFNTGDGIARISKAENTVADKTAHKLFNKWETYSDEVLTTPSVSLSYLDAVYGIRKVARRSAIEDKQTRLTTNQSIIDIVPVLDNVQALSADRARGSVLMLSMGEALRFNYDEMVFNTNTYQVDVEQRNVAGRVKYPLLTSLTNITDPSQSGGIARPVFDGEYTYPDVNAVAWGRILKSGNINEELLFKGGGTTDVTVLNQRKALYGLLNNEYIVFTEAVDNLDGTFSLTEPRRGAYHSHYARDFNQQFATNNAPDNGMWLVVDAPLDYPIKIKPLAVNGTVVVPQLNVPMNIPLQGRLYNKIPAPTNFEVTEDRISWTSQNLVNGVSKGTGQYVVAMYWGFMRDGMDGVYLMNTLSRTPYEDFASVIDKGENRFLWAGVAEGTSMPFPKYHSFQLADSVRFHQPVPIDIPDPTIPFSVYSDGWYFLDNYQDEVQSTLASYGYPQFWQGLFRGQNPAHPQHYEWMKRALIPSYKGWHWTWDGAGDVLHKAPEIPKLTGLYDYYGDRAKTGNKLVYPVADTSLLAETWFPAFPVPDTIFPIRHLLSLFMYKFASVRFVSHDLAYNTTEYHATTDKLLDETGASAYSEVFTEKLTVVRTLLDQFYDVQTPSVDDVTLLNKYNVGPLYTVATHDLTGEKIGEMFRQAVYEDTEHYLLPHNAKEVSILVAEVQDDGELGHFELLQNVAPKRKEPWCVTNTDITVPTQKTQKVSSYALVESTTAGCSMFSISYIVPPYAPPVNSTKTKRSAAYGLLELNIAAQHKKAVYGIMEPKP